MNKNFLKKNNVGILLISRIGSKRLNNKAKLKIKNLSLVEILLKRLKIKFRNENIVICTVDNYGKSFYKKISRKYGIKLFAGENKNVLKRIIDCMERFNFKHFVRATADNVMIDANVIDKLVHKHIKNNNEYTYTNCLASGMGSEVFSYKGLKKCQKNILDQNSTEYLTYFFLRKDIFKIQCVKIKKYYKFENRLNISVDYHNDYKNLKLLIESYKNHIYIDRKTIVKFLKENTPRKKLKSKIPIISKKYDARYKNDSKNKYLYLNNN